MLTLKIIVHNCNTCGEVEGHGGGEGLPGYAHTIFVYPEKKWGEKTFAISWVKNTGGVISNANNCRKSVYWVIIMFQMLWIAFFGLMNNRPSSKRFLFEVTN